MLTEGQAVELTPEQKAALDQIKWPDVVAYVHEQARNRHRARNLPRLEDEINFMMGAGSVLFALGMGHKFPSSWAFGFMAGRSPSGIEYRKVKAPKED